MVTKVSILGRSMCAERFMEIVKKMGKKTEIVSRVRLDNLPGIVDDLAVIRNSIPDSIFEADVILDYSAHPDVVYALEDAKKVITTAKCDLPNVLRVGCFCAADISEEFGVPVFKVKTVAGKVKEVEVKKSSPCGAAYFIAEEVVGMDAAEALEKIGLLAQYVCRGSGGPKSALHAAARIHKEAFEKGLM